MLGGWYERKRIRQAYREGPAKAHRFSPGNQAGVAMLGFFDLIFVLLMCSSEHYSWHRCVNPFNSSFSGANGSGTYTVRSTWPRRSGIMRSPCIGATIVCSKRHCPKPSCRRTWPSCEMRRCRIGRSLAVKAFKRLPIGSIWPGKPSSGAT